MRHSRTGIQKSYNPVYVRDMQLLRKRTRREPESRAFVRLGLLEASCRKLSRV